MIQLRPYQQAAVNAVYDHLKSRDDNPVVVLPTAAGKSWVIAQLARDVVCQWGGRVLVLAHVKELLEQNADKIQKLCPEVSIGIYSAGLNRREVSNSIIVAGIQSVYKKACTLDAFDLIIVDECHLITTDSEGMYSSFLAEAKVINPGVRVVGLTATPFRMASGPICTPDGILNHICYEVSVRDLIHEGYLCPLITKGGVKKAEFDRLHIRGGEFVPGEVEELMDDDQLVISACSEIIAYTHDRRSVLVFTSGIKHGQHVARVLTEMSGHEVGFLEGQTPTAERAELIANFRNGTLKYLVNVNVLTTGFDAPNIDCVAILRPTMSPGLFYQQCGRGFRLHPGKQNCLILDFGGNALRHGPVDQLRLPNGGQGGGSAPVKECPQCHTIIAAAYVTCPDCSFAFPPPERQKHDAQASSAGILSKQITDMEYEVRDIRYHVHHKRGSPQSMRVEYNIGQFTSISEWICFEHGGYARWKAEQWWRRRSNEPVPKTAEQAVEIANNGGLKWTSKIKVRTVAGEKYARIIDYTLGPKANKTTLDYFKPVDVPF